MGASLVKTTSLRIHLPVQELVDSMAYRLGRSKASVILAAIAVGVAQGEPAIEECAKEQERSRLEEQRAG